MDARRVLAMLLNCSGLLVIAGLAVCVAVSTLEASSSAPAAKQKPRPPDRAALAATMTPSWFGRTYYLVSSQEAAREVAGRLSKADESGAAAQAGSFYIVVVQTPEQASEFVDGLYQGWAGTATIDVIDLRDP
jgi:hypothetical protein